MMKIILLWMFLCLSITMFAQNRDSAKDVISKELNEQIAPVLDNLSATMADAAKAGLRSKYDMSDENYRYLAIGSGYGVSYGEFGAKIFSRFNKGFYAIGLSLGAGYSPNGRNKVYDVSGSLFWSAGLQIYLENFYIDYQVGTMRRIVEKGVEKNLLGLGLLVGYNWFFSNKCGLNLGVGVGGAFITDESRSLSIGEDQLNPFFAIDIGFIQRF